ncbi:MAG: protein glxC, partial [Pseudomonadota bacterium]
MDRRSVNRTLQAAGTGSFTVLNPGGAHAIACGLTTPVEVRVKGHAGYYAAGMNQQAQVTIEGNAGTGVAENMMSGTVRVTGDASQSAG